MKLSDLKTGMHVITTNGEEYVVMRDVVTHADGQTDTSSVIMTNIHYCSWLNLTRYNEDLSLCDSDSEYGIQKVYMPKFYRSLVASIKTKPEDFVLIWEFKKKMRLKEIEEALGYGVEIIE